jgi:hypothetical protein
VWLASARPNEASTQEAEWQRYLLGLVDLLHPSIPSKDARHINVLSPTQGTIGLAAAS